MNTQKIKSIVLVVTACVALGGMAFFPSQGLFQHFLSGIIFMGIFPFLAVKFVLRESVARYGWAFPQCSRRQSLIVGFLFLISVSLFLTLYAYTPLVGRYFPPEFLGQSFFLFCVYSVLIGGIFSFTFSAFFHGFTFFALEPRIKEWAVLAQWIGFVFFLFIIGNLNWDMTLYVYGALFAGVATHVTRSMFSGFLFLWFFVILTDILLLKLF